MKVRRVVTGHSPDGKATVASDTEVNAMQKDADGSHPILCCEIKVHLGGDVRLTPDPAEFPIPRFLSNSRPTRQSWRPRGKDHFQRRRRLAWSAVAMPQH